MWCSLCTLYLASLASHFHALTPHTTLLSLHYFQPFPCRGRENGSINTLVYGLLGKRGRLPYYRNLKIRIAGSLEISLDITIQITYN